MKQDSNLREAGAYDEYNKWVTFNGIAICIAAAVILLSFHLIYPLEVLVFEPIDGAASVYFRDLFGGVPYEKFLQYYYFDWFASVWRNGEEFPYSWFVFVAIVISAVMCVTRLNPHRKTPNIYGDARWATKDDILAMERRNLLGFNGKLAVAGKFDGKLLRMGETLSLLLLAPPGTGKTVGFIVPSAVSLDNACLFIHDQKPELHDMVSGHRSRLGPVFQLKWSAVDKPDGDWIDEDQMKRFPPDLLATDENGALLQDEYGRYKTKPIYYPSWNPLSPGSLPAPGPARDTYIERLVNVMCPDPVSGGDKFWTQMARAALIGMIHFVAMKVECSQDPKIRASLRGIPEEWHGKEPSLPMLVDWIAHAQREYDDGSEDPMRTMLKATIDEAYEMNEAWNRHYGGRPLARAINELTGLMNQPDKTRGSVMSTVDSALNPFKNLAVRQRMERSSFSFADLRGMPKKEAREREQAKLLAARERGEHYQPSYRKEDYEPITIIISVNQVDAKAFANLTAMFVDTANAYLTTYGPGEYDEDQKRKLGPFDFGMLLDECPQLPKLDSVMKSGPAVGRSKRVFYFIVGQDFGQFREKYSNDEVEGLKTNTAIKIILTQNNPSAAEEISKMVGKITHKKFSESDRPPEKGIMGMFLPKKKSSSESWEGTEFLKTQFIMSMPEGKHVVIVQNYTNRPILCDTPRFFEEKDLAKKVFNLREFTGPPPAPPMPLEWMDMVVKQGSAQLATREEAAALRRGLSEPRHVLIATPRDLRSLCRDDLGRPTGQQQALYAWAEVDIPEDAGFIEPPEHGEIEVGDDLQKLVAFVRDNRFIVFDETTLEEEINSKLRLQGLPTLRREAAVFLAERAEKVGETHNNDLHYLGYNGGPCLDLPDRPEMVTPQFTLRWISEIMTFILGIEEQRRLFAPPN